MFLLVRGLFFLGAYASHLNFDVQLLDYVVNNITNVVSGDIVKLTGNPFFELAQGPSFSTLADEPLKE